MSITRHCQLKFVSKTEIQYVPTLEEIAILRFCFTANCSWKIANCRSFSTEDIRSKLILVFH